MSCQEMMLSISKRRTRLGQSIFQSARLGAERSVLDTNFDTLARGAEESMRWINRRMISSRRKRDCLQKYTYECGHRIRPGAASGGL